MEHRVGEAIGFCGLSGPGDAKKLTGLKKAGGTACPTNSGQVGQAVSPANPGFSCNCASRRPIPTDDEKRSSVPQWRVRAGEPADLEAIAAIQSASPEAALWPPGDYLQYDLRVAERQRRVAGFLVARRTAEGEAEVLNLAVAPEFRRQGVARALMRAFLHGFQGDVFLEVRSSNLSALEFYKSLGFQELTLRTDYYERPPEAAIVMKFHSC